MRAQQGQVSAAAAEFMTDTPMYQLYQRVAPRPEDFPRLLDKMGESMAKDFDFTEEVRGLQVPTLIVAADADMAPPSHYVEVFRLLDGGLRDGGWMGEGRPQGGHALAILPGLTHYNIFSSPLFAAVTLAFLDGSASRTGLGTAPARARRDMRGARARADCRLEFRGQMGCSGRCSRPGRHLVTNPRFRPAARRWPGCVRSGWSVTFASGRALLPP